MRLRTDDGQSGTDSRRLGISGLTETSKRSFHVVLQKVDVKNLGHRINGIPKSSEKEPTRKPKHPRREKLTDEKRDIRGSHRLYPECQPATTAKKSTAIHTRDCGDH